MPHAWVEVEDYKFPGGWLHPSQGSKRSREYCEMLEGGEILFFLSHLLSLRRTIESFCCRSNGPSFECTKMFLTGPAMTFYGVSLAVLRRHEPMRFCASTRNRWLDLCRSSFRRMRKSEYWILRAFVRSRKMGGTYLCIRETICCMWTLSPVGQREVGGFCGYLRT